MPWCLLDDAVVISVLCNSWVPYGTGPKKTFLDLVFSGLCWAEHSESYMLHNYNTTTEIICYVSIRAYNHHCCIC